MFIVEAVEAHAKVQTAGIFVSDPSNPHNPIRLNFWSSVEPDVIFFGPAVAAG